MSTTDSWTVGRLLTWTTDYLKEHGSQSPRLDAEVLLAHARGCQRIELYTAFDDEPTEEARAAFREMVRRRAEGTPVAYLVGHKEFYSADFEVNPDVLIPRPETEYLIVEALDRAKQLANSTDVDRPNQVLRIADIGTGSGIIAITMALHFENCQVTAIDVSPAALEVTARNLQRHSSIAQRVEIRQGDLFSACEPNEQFDLILSNPPYVTEKEFADLDPSVRDYEPSQALRAGDDGLDVIRPLIADATARVVPGGFLIFEFSPMLADSLGTLVDDAWSEPTITKDGAGLARIVTLQRIANP